MVFLSGIFGSGRYNHPPLPDPYLNSTIILFDRNLFIKSKQKFFTIGLQKQQRNKTQTMHTDFYLDMVKTKQISIIHRINMLTGRRYS